MPNPHDYFMQEALKEAHKAFNENEIPVGAIIISKDIIIGRGHNQVERLHDSTAHAEMIALTAAMEHFNSKYLKNCTLYVTLEPCLMCASAIGHAQVRKVVYGASDPEHGFEKYDQTIRSSNGNGSAILHPKSKVSSGILEDSCKEILDEFFLGKRAK